MSLQVDSGEVVSLVGANGAGKTTTLKAVSGIIAPRSGRIVFDGKELTGLPQHRIARMGISHVPEGRGVFANMTVRENLDMGAYTRRSRREVGESLERVFALFPRLAERSGQMAGTLSGGEQQMLAIGRAMVARPALMLLDEPSMGMSPVLVEEIFKMIAEVNRGGTTVLLVEQNAFMALAIARRAYVLEAGRMVLSGDSTNLQNDPRVQAAYLGDVPGDG
ncbi:MAG TPA: ABC transporter ATP-binding protein [Candidatus Deferrimicrobiaceae bacterium]|nr:ABC transporter ATP-binding protein [Candidatus Deferrimicrobiaceae bacterium]